MRVVKTGHALASSRCPGSAEALARASASRGRAYRSERRSMARNDVRIRCNREALAAAHAAQVVAHADAHGRVNASCEAALHSLSLIHI